MKLMPWVLILVCLSLPGCRDASPESSRAGLTIFKYKVVVQGKTAEDLNAIPLYRELEKRTGIPLRFIHPKNGKFEAELEELVRSGNIPDLIYIPNLETFHQALPRYIETGLIRPFDDLLATAAPHFAAVLAAHPEWEEEIRSPDGKLYVAPFLVGHPFLRVWFGPIVRRDWLREFDLEEPETLEDWYQMLKAFQQKTPHPLTMAGPSRGYQSFTRGHVFIGAFELCWGFYQEKGQVRFGQYQPAYRDFLALMRRWYAEGLCDPDFMYNDNALVDTRLSRGEAGAFLGAAGSDLGEWLDRKRPTDPAFDLVGVKYPVLQRGRRAFSGQMDKVFNGRGYCITTAARAPALCLRWLDYGYSAEGHLLYNFGIEGESFRREEGEPVYTELVTANPDGLTMTQVLARYTRVTYNSAIVQDERYLNQFYQWPQCMEAKLNWSQTDAADHLLPELLITGEAGQRLAAIMSRVEPYVEEMFIRFISGEEPLEEFATYRRQLEILGIKEALAIWQQVLADRVLSGYGP